MSTTKSNSGSKQKRRQASTPLSLEQQNYALAQNLAYQRLSDGTASNQLICEVLRNGSKEKQLKCDILESQKKLVDAKTEAIHDAKDMKEMYSKALAAMRTYSGLAGVDEDDEELFRVN